jgi:hypothetical protein
MSAPEFQGADIATDYGLDDRGAGVRVPVVSRIFPSHVLQASSGVDPAPYPMGTGGSFPGGKADHSTPAGAEVKKMWIHTSTPSYAFLA